MKPYTKIVLLYFRGLLFLTALFSYAFNRSSERLKMMGSKKCLSCGEVKPVSDFWKDNKSHDGLQTMCAACKKKQRTERLYTEEGRRARKEAYAKYEKKRALDPEEKRKASCRKKTRSLIHKGFLQKERCLFCGSKQTEVHHSEEYDPYVFVCLCHEHHGKLEGRILCDPAERSAMKVQVETRFKKIRKWRTEQNRRTA